MKIPKKITHQVQPTPTSCASTCIAMLLNIDVNIVIDEFHDGFMSHNEDMSGYLKRKGLDIVELMSTNNMIMWDKVYLMTVPSLNLKGINHYIVGDSRGDLFKVYDPNKGKDGKFYYCNEDDDNPLSFRIQTWSLDYEVKNK